MPSPFADFDIPMSRSTRFDYYLDEVDWSTLPATEITARGRNPRGYQSRIEKVFNHSSFLSLVS